jgi:hypothetical protein
MNKTDKLIKAYKEELNDILKIKEKIRRMPTNREYPLTTGELNLIQTALYFFKHDIKKTINTLEKDKKINEYLKKQNILK